ncbi:class I SAM-dependent methyltransferase [Aeoliella mucimassa]|uniref:Methyltransferase type 11 domain-containing protein n=1 Tax=Aeoliella mucimassa TaxID=2527972 RepID=A0A518ANU1_9BACT|nr:class I SAM-dependent methyltransferase [Aeoliella mucimassa]QDU56395.1 hypothetical protein Pan181_26040 [Aeoliella mucimassa]
MAAANFKHFLKTILGKGPASKRTCPLCSWTGRQFTYGGAQNKIRFDSSCPNCRSLERHRLAYLTATSQPDLDYSQVLHVAPEKQIEHFLRSKAGDYLSIDYYNNAMAKMDVTALELEDNSKTLIWISHVLEHVERDDLAIAEMFRVLKPGGVAFVQVPIWREETYEDFSIQSEADRLRVFYQPDHVRLYGMDIVDRFHQAGFSSKVIRAQDFGPEKIIEHQLSFASTNEVFLFRKG